MLKALIISGSILAVGFVSLLCAFLFVLQYPKLKKLPKIGKWYKITGNDMLCSDGSRYKAFFRKGSENKVLVYFAGGGVSINAETAREDMFIRRVAPIDRFAINMMNSGGIADSADCNPFRDWSVIALPYATGDLHTGTNDLEYTGKDGNKRILCHHGYTNYTAVMRTALELGGISGPDAVMVTGFSAGAAAAALLADDVFKSYFPNAKSRTVLVDSMLVLINDWHSIAADVWKSPAAISDRIRTNNIVLDSLTALHEDFGDDVTILFDCSAHDGELAKAQNLFDNGRPEVDEQIADRFRQVLKETIPQLREIGAYLYIWDGLPFYDDPRNITKHTIIADPYVFSDLNRNGVSVAEWAFNAVNRRAENYGLELADRG